MWKKKKNHIFPHVDSARNHLYLHEVQVVAGVALAGPLTTLGTLIWVESSQTLQPPGKTVQELWIQTIIISFIKCHWDNLSILRIIIIIMIGIMMVIIIIGSFHGRRAPQSGSQCTLIRELPDCDQIIGSWIMVKQHVAHYLIENRDSLQHLHSWP